MDLNIYLKHLGERDWNFSVFLRLNGKNHFKNKLYAIVSVLFNNSIWEINKFLSVDDTEIWHRNIGEIVVNCSDNVRKAITRYFYLYFYFTNLLAVLLGII